MDNRCYTLASLIDHNLHIAQLTSAVDCLYLSWFVHIPHMSTLWTARITLDLQTLVTRHRELPIPISFSLHICQPTSTLAFPHCLWPAHNGKLVSNMAFPHAFVLQRMVNQRHTLPTRIAFVLHTIVSRHRTCATPIICGLHKSISQRRTCPAIIFISLYTLVYRCHT